MLRIWSETLPLEELGRPAVLGLLRRYELRPLVAVRPGQQAALAQLAGRLRDAGLAFGLWPMLADADGRWASAANLEAFAELTRASLQACGPAAPAEVALDLEPPIALLRPWVDAGGPERAPPFTRLEAARARLAALVAEVEARGAATLAALIPALPFEPAGQAGWQAALGTPVDGVGLGHLSVMAYSSLFEGWSRRLLGRADALALLAACAAQARARYGARAGLSLGAVGLGAFGNEPTYRSPAELAEDVAVARAAGVEALTLLDLGGVLARPPAEAWLEALVHTPPARALPEPTARARAALSALRLGGRALEAALQVGLLR